MRHGLCHHRGVVQLLAVSGGETAVENVVILVERQKFGIDKGNRRQLFGCWWNSARTRLFCRGARLDQQRSLARAKKETGSSGRASKERVRPMRSDERDKIRWKRIGARNLSISRPSQTGDRSAVRETGTGRKGEREAKRMDAVGAVTSGGHEKGRRACRGCVSRLDGVDVDAGLGDGQGERRKRVRDGSRRQVVVRRGGGGRRYEESCLGSVGRAQSRGHKKPDGTRVVDGKKGDKPAEGEKVGGHKEGEKIREKRPSFFPGLSTAIAVAPVSCGQRLSESGGIRSA